MKICKEAFDFLVKIHKHRSQLPLQGAVGRAPADFLNLVGYNEQKIGGGRIVDQLDRSKVRLICRNKSIQPLDAYSVAMSWGGQRYDHFRNSKDAGNLPPLLEGLRLRIASREADFDWTKQQAATIKGLGISFYTKLLYFFRTNEDAYILDKWTALGINALFEDSPIALFGDLPHPKTTGSQYEKFCQYIEFLATEMEKVIPFGWTGDMVEMAIFDRPKGPWRQFLSDNNPENGPGKMAVD